DCVEIPDRQVTAVDACSVVVEAQHIQAGIKQVDKFVAGHLSPPNTVRTSVSTQNCSTRPPEDRSTQPLLLTFKIRPFRNDVISPDGFLPVTQRVSDHIRPSGCTR